MSGSWRTPGRKCGFSLVEVLISSFLAVVVLGTSAMLLSAGSNLHQSSIHATAAARRCDHVLWPLVNDLRKASLASVRRGDGSTIPDGGSAEALRMRVVERVESGVPLGPEVIYSLSIPTGATAGQLLRTTDTGAQVLARGVSQFRITRAGDRFTFELTTGSGPGDDRGRESRGRASATPRNR